MDALFSTHPKSKYWIQEKNGTITPSNIKCNNQSMKYWFRCDICNHDFDSIIHSITKGSWCGFCANCRRCNREDCEFCFNHSFASHDKAKYWSNKNKSKPRDWALCCNDKFWFICEENMILKYLLIILYLANGVEHVIASDGLWDVMSNESIGAIVCGAASAESAAATLLTAALAAGRALFGAPVQDNTAIVVVYL